MKKIIGLLASLTIFSAIAFSGAPANSPNFGIGDKSASADQSISVKIPARVAVHVDTPSWNLNLNSMDNEACFAISKVWATNFGTAADAFTMIANLAAGALTAEMTDWATAKDALLSTVEDYAPEGIAFTNRYPAVDIDGDNYVSGNNDKGYVVCLFGKVVQKFANTPWTFTASLNASNSAKQTGFGHFGMADIVGGTLYGSFVTPVADGTSHGLASDTKRTPGWLDDYILEGFYFDGTEVADTYELTVTYTLTGNY